MNMTGKGKIMDNSEGLGQAMALSRVQDKADKALEAATDALSPSEIWHSFQQMAKDPDIDPVKMQTLYEVQKQMITDLRQEEFNSAKFNAMADMPTITRNRVILDKKGKVRSRYSDFKHLYLTVKPILQAQGLILDFDVDETQLEGKVPMLRVAPILRHQNGYVWHGSYMPVPITVPNQTVTMTQAAKGAVETGKRTVLIACLGITEDEDESLTGATMDQMTEAQEKLWSDATDAAAQGVDAYRKWFESRTNAERGWLAYTGKHEDLKAGAAKHDEGTQTDG